MISNKIPKSFKIINKLNNFLLIMSVLSGIILFIYSGSIIFGDNDYMIDFKTSNYDRQESSNFTFNEIDYRIPLVKYKVAIDIQTLPLIFQILIGIYFTIGSILIFLIFFQFKLFISNVIKEKYFDIGNIIFLKRISYILAAFWLVKLIPLSIKYYLPFRIEPIKIDTVEGFNLIYIFLALIIWMLAYIFEKGIELKDENKLTI
jgi:hypothetical protein